MNLQLNDSILHDEIAEFEFANPPIDPVELADTLYNFMKENGGAGLAANQVGLSYRVAVFATEPKLVMYNPKIVYYNDEYSVKTEGCLSHPGFFCKIRRPTIIRVRYYNEEGNLETNMFDNEIARIVQHEVDHLNGIDYIDRASEIHLKEAKRKSKYWKRKAKQMVKTA